MRLLPVLAVAHIAVITVFTVDVAHAVAPARATLAAAALKERVITDGGMWRCAEAGCTGSAPTTLRQAVAVCAAVAETAGRVATFTTGDFAFTEPALARCNRRARDVAEGSR